MSPNCCFGIFLHGATCLVRGLELIAPALELLDAIQLLFPRADFVMSSVFLFFSFEACRNCFDNQFSVPVTKASLSLELFVSLQRIVCLREDFVMMFEILQERFVVIFFNTVKFRLKVKWSV